MSKKSYFSALLLVTILFIFFATHQRLKTTVAQNNLTEDALVKSAWTALDSNDYTNALKIFTKASSSDVGRFVDYFFMGYMYQYGLGTKKNLEASVKWYEKAIVSLNWYEGLKKAEAVKIPYLLFIHSEPNPKAVITYQIGLDYVGLNDYVNAFQNFQKAAKFGNPSAQYSVALCYATGRGVIMNYIKAYAWASVAAAVGVNKQHEYVINQFISFLKQKLILQGYANNPSHPDGELQQAQALAKQYYNLYVLHEPTSET